MSKRKKKHMPGVTSINDMLALFSHSLKLSTSAEEIAHYEDGEGNQAMIEFLLLLHHPDEEERTLVYKVFIKNDNSIIIEGAITSYVGMQLSACMDIMQSQEHLFESLLTDLRENNEVREVEMQVEKIEGEEDATM